MVSERAHIFTAAWAAFHEVATLQVLVADRYGLEVAWLRETAAACLVVMGYRIPGLPRGVVSRRVVAGMVCDRRLD
jgi:hypothetical protein